MKQLILETISRHVEEKKIIRNQHEFKGQPWLTNLLSFYNEVISLMDEGEAEDIVFLDFSKDSAPRKILTEKLSKLLGEQ